MMTVVVVSVTILAIKVSKSFDSWVTKVMICPTQSPVTWTSSFLPVLKALWIYFLPELQTVKKQLLKEPSSVQMIDARVAKLSD